MTGFRKRLGQLRTRTINQVKYLLRKHNLEQDCPTKALDTIKGKKWLTELTFSRIDRLQMDQLLTQWTLWDEQIEKALPFLGVEPEKTECDPSQPVGVQ